MSFLRRVLRREEVPADVAGRLASPLPGLAPGPWLPFADLAISPDGAVIVGCDGAGTLVAIASDD